MTTCSPSSPSRWEAGGSSSVLCTSPTLRELSASQTIRTPRTEGSILAEAHHLCKGQGAYLSVTMLISDGVP